MATNYTNLLGFALPTTGELSNTWGNVVNNSITELVEDAIAATATASVTAGDWTLSDTGAGVANEARCAIIIPTGTPGVSRNVIAPSQSKAYVVINESDAAIVFKGAGSPPTTGVTIPANDRALVAWDGSDFVRVGASAGGSNTQVQYNDNGNLGGAASFTFNSGTGAVTATSFSGSGAALTALNASNVSSGTLAVARGGTGQTTYTDGQLLIGNSSGNTLTKATLTQGSGVTITNGNGSITIAATGTGGTLTSVGMTVPTFLSVSPASITTSGTFAVTLSGTALPVVNGGTGQTTYTDGELLIGNTSGNTLTKATLTAGTGVSITNGNGSITISATGTGGTVTSVSSGTGLTGGPITGAGTLSVATNGITDTLIRQSAAYSVVGRSGSTTGNVADISAASDYQVLRRSGTSIGFGAISLDQSNAVTGTLATGNGGTGLASFTANRVFYASSTSAVAQSANLTFDGTTLTADTVTAKLKAYSEAVTTATVSTATYNLDTSLTNIFDITLGNNVTFTFTNPPTSGISRSVTVILRQDATGNRTATFTNAYYSNGLAPTLSTGANDIDVLTFFTVNGGSFWFGTFAMADVS